MPIGLGVLIAGGIVILIGAGVLTHQNWSSEALRANLISATVLGLAGLIVTLILSLTAPAPKLVKFNVVVVVDNGTALPVSVDVQKTPLSVRRYLDPFGGPFFFPIPRGILREAGDPPLSNERLSDAYRDIVTAKIVETYQRLFGASWDVDIDSTDASMAISTLSTRQRTPVAPVSRIGAPELFRGLPDEAKWETFVFLPTGHVGVPPGTESHWESEVEWDRVWRLKGPLASVSVRLRRSGMECGSGMLVPPRGLDAGESELNLTTIRFVVEASATFERWRSGDRLMPHHVRWVDLFFEELRRLDSAPRRQRVLEEESLALAPPFFQDRAERRAKEEERLRTEASKLPPSDPAPDERKARDSAREMPRP